MFLDFTRGYFLEFFVWWGGGLYQKMPVLYLFLIPAHNADYEKVSRNISRETF